MTHKQAPSILAFVTDLFFTSRIESAATKLGYHTWWIDQMDELTLNEQGLYTPGTAEPVQGPGAALIDLVSRLRPNLLIFDIGSTEIPWRSWIAAIKSSPATRRIPVLCFGAHRDTQVLNAARSSGADAVVARSAFVESLPELIEKYSRSVDYRAIETACREPLSEIAVRGLEEFNRGEFFEAHETLEEAWNREESAGKELYRAILQVAVAYLQIERGNYRGAMKMFLRLRQWIDPLPDICRGVNIDLLRIDAEQVHRALEELGGEHIAQFDRNLFKPVIYKP